MAREPLKIAESVDWVGALNPKLRIFDTIMRTEQGTTYNAYLIRGKEKIVLIDTVKHGFSQEMFDRIEKIIFLEKIDYIIVNHLEPDHSGAIPEAVRRMPNARLVVSKNGKTLLKELMNQDLDPLTVGTGDSLNLGNKTLQFITAPFLHWPDTMFTYLREDEILFSCDFFGSHYCHPAMFADQVGDFSYSRKYYFDHIFRPFKEYVLRGLEAIKPLSIKVIAPSHGPILNSNIAEYSDLYRQWSSCPQRIAEGSLLVFYVSAYGLTRELAQAVAEGALSTGVRTLLYDLVSTEISDLLEAIETADGLAIGSCTINGDAVKPIWDLLGALATLKLKGKWTVAFGSYGWSGEAVPMIEERMKSLKMKSAAPGLRVKLTPGPRDLAAARELGIAIAEKIKSAVQSSYNQSEIRGA